jgi:hypothetical protein
MTTRPDELERSLASLVTAYVPGAVVGAAVELGVFDALAEARTIDELASHLDVSADGVARLVRGEVLHRSDRLGEVELVGAVGQVLRDDARARARRDDRGAEPELGPGQHPHPRRRRTQEPTPVALASPGREDAALVAGEAEHGEQEEHEKRDPAEDQAMRLIHVPQIRHSPWRIITQRLREGGRSSPS